MGKTLTKQQIPTIRMMVNTTPGLLPSLLKGYTLTEDFVEEFQYDLTPELFTTSYRLPVSIAEKFPSLFSESIMEEYLTGAKERQEVSDKVQQMLNDGVDSDEVNEMATAANQNIDADVESHWKNISISMFLKMKDALAGNTIPEESELKEILYNICAVEDPKEIEENALNLMGISEKLDKLILNMVKDDDVKTQLLLTQMVNSHSGCELSPAVLSQMPNNLKESYLYDDDLTGDTFVKILTSARNDFGFVKEKLEEVVSGKINFKKAYGVTSKDILFLIASLPEDIAIKILEIADKFSGAFTPEVFEKALMLKSFSEEQLISAAPALKKTGGLLALKHYAKRCGFNDLLASL